MNEDFSFNESEIKLLKKMIGEKLISLHTEHAPDENEYWWPIYIKFNNFSLTVVGQMTAANYYDGKEDCSRLTIKNNKDIIPAVYIKTVRHVVQDVILVNNIITYSYPDSPKTSFFKFIYPRALLVILDNCILTIERGWHFENYLVMRLQDKNHVELIDELPEWYDSEEDQIKPVIKQTRISVK